MRPRTSVVMPNAATMLQKYRNDTASMTPYFVSPMRTCPCCKKRRSETQFSGSAKSCANCRRPR